MATPSTTPTLTTAREPAPRAASRRPRLSVLVLALVLLADLAAIAAVIGTAPGTRRAAAPLAPPPARWTRVGPTTLVKAIVSAPGAARLLYAATTDGALRSDDGGRHWTFHNAGFSAEGRALWDLVVFDQGKRLAAAGSDGHVYLSDAPGGRWTASRQTLGDSAVYALAASPVSPDTLLAGAAGGIWRSDDGGMQWRIVQGTGDAGVAAFAWLAHPPEVYAALLPGPNQVLRGTDSGRTWRPAAAGLDPKAGLMAIQAGTGTVLAGTMGHGLWRLNPAGGHWQPSDGGFPAAGHGASFTVGATPNLLWVGTMGDGVYSSRDGGRHWARFGSTLQGADGIVLALAVDGHWLYAGTATGIFRIPVS